MGQWTEERVRFMEEALAYTDYYRLIAERIGAMLRPSDRLCDAGCGLGELGIRLLPYCAHVTAVDADEAAIVSMRRRAPAGVAAICGDVETLVPPEPYDAMVFCLFGGMEQTLRIAGAQCRGRVFLVKREYDTHRFSPGALPLGDYTAENARWELSRRGVPFQEQVFTAEFGQPLRSMEEAERFFALYNRNAERSFTQREIAARLTAGPTEEYPLYLPNEKRLCLLTFQAQDIP